MDIMRKVKGLAESEGFDRVVSLGRYKNWDLYVAGLQEECVIGLPQYILASDQDVRWATIEETEDIMDTIL